MTFEGIVVPALLAALLALAGCLAYVLLSRDRTPSPQGAVPPSEPLAPDVDDLDLPAAARRASGAALQDIERHAEELARGLLVAAMERCAATVVAESATSTFPLASEDLKGRIIGREGRNLAALQGATGVDLIIEEDACAVTISSLDPVRREVARRSLRTLLAEGRMQPARIEAVVAAERAALDASLRDLGAEAARRAKVSVGPDPVMEAMGVLAFRSSASQNVLEHSVQCAEIAAFVAAELGADAPSAARAAFLHDIGKGLDGSWGPAHAEAGAAFLRAQGEDEAVCEAVRAHHDERAPDVLSAIVRISDAVSGARPGARRADAAAFLSRVQALEALAGEEPGVADAYAVKAGRELRVVVKSDVVDDAAARELSMRIAQRVSDHPETRGRVLITVIRETRHEAWTPPRVP